MQFSVSQSRLTFSSIELQCGNQVISVSNMIMSKLSLLSPDEILFSLVTHLGFDKKE